MRKAHTPWQAQISVAWDRPQPFNSVPLTSPDEVGRVISQTMEAITAASNGFSTFPIVVKVTGPHVPDLTMIDLPGMPSTSFYYLLIIYI